MEVRRDEEEGRRSAEGRGKIGYVAVASIFRASDASGLPSPIYLFKMTKRIGSVRDLDVYPKAFRAAMDIFEISKSFPKEETYSLTDQIRRSSRSVCSNLAEGWRKRKYRAVFLNRVRGGL